MHFRYLQGLHSWIKLLGGGAGGLSGYMYECVWIFELFDMLFFVLLVLVLLLVLAQRWLCICMFGCVVLLLVFVLLFFPGAGMQVHVGACTVVLALFVSGCVCVHMSAAGV